MSDDCYWTKEEDVRIIVAHGRSIEVCPCCVDHEQLHEAERGMDCKNQFYIPFKGTTGQCNCWSEAHAGH